MQIKHLLIGSRALELLDASFSARDNSDYDIVSIDPRELEGNSGIRIEIHQPDILNNFKLLDTKYSDHTIVLNGVIVHVATKPVLAMIKRSHLHRDLKFGQHIATYHKHLARYMKRMSKADVEFLQERTALTHKMFPQKGPNLNQTVEEFFDDAVTKKYNHDYLHSLFAYYDKPMYTKLQHDHARAWCSKDLWEELTHEDKLKCIAEETYVIATERFLVPKDWNYPMKLAYAKALNKVCTTLCSNWFRDKAINHYPELLQMMDENKFLQVKEKLANLG